MTVIDGRRVVKGMTATEEQCRKVNAIERDKALARVDPQYQSASDRATEGGYRILLPV